MRECRRNSFEGGGYIDLFEPLCEVEGEYECEFSKIHYGTLQIIHEERSASDYPPTRDLVFVNPDGLFFVLSRTDPADGLNVTENFGPGADAGILSVRIKNATDITFVMETQLNRTMLSPESDLYKYGSFEDPSLCSFSITGADAETGEMTAFCADYKDGSTASVRFTDGCSRMVRVNGEAHSSYDRATSTSDYNFVAVQECFRSG